MTAAGFVVPVRAAIRITPDGRTAHEQWARVAIGSEVEAAVTRGYERFLPINVEFLRICNDWQVRPGNVPNDHGDAAYDWTVIDRLRTLDERTAPVVRRVGAVRRPFRCVPAATARGPEPGRRGRTRVVHLAPHRLVPHGLDAAPRGPVAGARQIA